MNKYEHMKLPELEARWNDVVNVLNDATRYDRALVTLLPDECWSIVRSCRELVTAYRIGRKYQVFPKHEELEDGSIFHALLLEMRAAAEQDETLTLEREDYQELTLCLHTLATYGIIALSATHIDMFPAEESEDGV